MVEAYSMEACEVLPTELWQSIFNHLEDDDLEAVSLVCKDFLEISNICKESLEVVHPKVSMLSKLLKRFKHLKIISLRQFLGDLDDAISEIIRSDTSLDVLGISDQYGFDALCLKDLDSNSKMKDLKSFNYMGFCDLRPADLVLIANYFPNLEQLKFGKYFYFRDRPSFTYPNVDAIDFLASKLKLLKKIHVAGSYICDQSLVALSQNCVLLKAVTIWGANHEVTENGIGLLLRNRSNLEALSIAYVDSSQSDITIENSISHAKALTSLAFFHMDVSDMLLNAIAKANLPLTMFGLKFCETFTVRGLLIVLSNINITKLRICEADFTDADMELLLTQDVEKLTYIDISNLKVTISMLLLLSAKCPSLVEIRINSASSLDRFRIEDNNISWSKNHKIRNLYLRNSKIGDELVEKFAIMFPNLKVLDLSECRNVTSKGIEAIFESCKFIRKLILEGYSKEKLIEDDTKFQELYLEDLTLSSSRINDEGLATIAKKCRRLVSLNLDHCNKITIEGLKQIIKNITTLNLHICSVYDRIYGDCLLQWMLSTGNFASIKKYMLDEIIISKMKIKEIDSWSMVFWFYQRRRPLMLIHLCIRRSS